MSDSLRNVTLSVGQITQLLKQTIEQSFYGISLRGEISNFRPASSGHWYFQLNDEAATISAVMFKNRHWKLSFVPKDGDVVIVVGSIGIYEKRGTYQIVCESMEQAGTGDILALLEQRKRLYEKKGYFAPEHKQPIPKDPKRVGVITSPTGAAVRDIIQVMTRRNDTIDIIVLPAPVQGEDAAAIIAAQIQAANRLKVADVLIIGRGGGSLEDLLPFSDPKVIEAIYASEIPIVSAVGHEIDWAISDFVADLRAPTPSAAAELVCSDKRARLEELASYRQSMTVAIRGRITLAQTLAHRFSLPVMSDYFMRTLQTIRMSLDYAKLSIGQQMHERIVRSKHALELVSGQLHNLSPSAILARGYSITMLEKTNEVVRESSQVASGDTVAIVLANGKLKATVVDGNR